MNIRKTKIMAGTARTTTAVYVNGIQLDQVEDYVYLGQHFTLTEKNQDNEIRKIKAGWQAFWRHSTTMKGTLPTCLKRSLQPVHPSSYNIWSRPGH